MIAYAVREKSTGLFLPVLTKNKKRGFSFTEPTDGIPRLHLTERRAKSALRAWVDGHWYWEDVPDGSCPQLVAGRNINNMEVVAMSLLVQQKVE